MLADHGGWIGMLEATPKPTTSAANPPEISFFSRRASDLWPKPIARPWANVPRGSPRPSVCTQGAAQNPSPAIASCPRSPTPGLSLGSVSTARSALSPRMQISGAAQPKDFLRRVDFFVPRAGIFSSNPRSKSCRSFVLTLGEDHVLIWNGDQFAIVRVWRRSSR